MDLRPYTCVRCKRSYTVPVPVNEDIVTSCPYCDAVILLEAQDFEVSDLSEASVFDAAKARSFNLDLLREALKKKGLTLEKKGDGRAYTLKEKPEFWLGIGQGIHIALGRIQIPSIATEGLSYDDIAQIISNLAKGSRRRRK